MIEAVEKDMSQRSARARPKLSPEGTTVLPPHRTAAAWAALPTVNPDSTRLRRHRIIAHRGGGDSAHFDMMRMRVLRQMRQNNWRRLAITSPTARCGKSTVALNLAFSLSRQSALRTLLLDLDFRRPSLLQMMGLALPQDLAACLRGEHAIVHSACQIGAGLGLSANAAPVPDATEIFTGHSMPSALGAVEDALAPDISLFDTPPMLSCPDMIGISSQVDCVLIIAQADRTTTREIDLCERELARQTNVMGVVLNRCRVAGDGYGYAPYD